MSMEPCPEYVAKNPAHPLPRMWWCCPVCGPDPKTEDFVMTGLSGVRRNDGDKSKVDEERNTG